QAEIGSANRLLVANNRERMYTTLFCGVLDVLSGRLTYCNCGHNPPLILRRDGRTFESLPSCGPPLGIKAAASYVPGSIELAAGDILLLYTDGVSEAEAAGGAQFGMERLQQTMRDARGQSAHGVVEHILESVAQFTQDAPQSDDITCVAVVRNER